MKDDRLISLNAAIDAMLKLQTEDIEAYGASIPEGFDGDRAVMALKALPSAADTNVGGNLSVDELITFLNPESNYVFYDDSHGFCINTQDVLDHLCAMPSARLAQDLPNTCTDAISRQAAIKTAHLPVIDDAGYEVVRVNDILALPSAQPGWIPCTPETMPKMTDTYLVQVGINENGEGMHTEVRTAVWNVVWHKWYVHTTRCFVGDIIKWMPIPWEGGQE